MIEKLSEKENIWNALAKSDKPAVIYGMGNGAEKIIEALGKYGVGVSDIFASDEFVRGHSFKGFRVKKYSEICEKYDDFNVILAFATHLDDVLEKIHSINLEHSVYAPDVPVAGTGLFTLEYIRENEEKFDYVYSRLADDESRRVYLDIINFKVSGKTEYLTRSFCSKKDIYENILKPGDNETVADLGAYDGDTIREFTNFTGGKYRRIYALEPDEKNYRKLVKNTAGMPNIKTYNMGAWSHRDTLLFSSCSGRNSHLSHQGTEVQVTDLDSLTREQLTLIKMDVEGSELKALEGAEKIIAAYRPKLYVCAYHRNDDLFTLPLKIWQMCPDYKIYFRHTPYIPAWESNFYCVI